MSGTWLPPTWLLNHPDLPPSTALSGQGIALGVGVQLFAPYILAQLHPGWGREGD